MATFYIALLEGLVIVAGIAYGLHKLFPKVPSELWFLLAAFLFVGWFMPMAIGGSV